MSVKTLCLNMVVHNTKEALERCLSVLPPHIVCWVVADLGSTDGTPEFLRSFFAARNIPGELHYLGYYGYAMARQTAFDRARASALQYDYVLLLEPKAELAAQDTAHSPAAPLAAYKILPRSGTICLNAPPLRPSPIDLWQQDIFVSLLNVARLKESFNHSSDEILAAYAEATEACPTRGEALHGAARFCRNKGIYERGYELATRGLHVPLPTHALASEDWIYEYGLLDELAVNAFWAGKYEESSAACDQLLAEGKLPANQRDRVQGNKNAAAAKLQEARESSSQATSSDIAVENHDAIYKRFLKDLDASLIEANLAAGFWQQTCEDIRNDAVNGNKFDFLRWPSLSVFSVPESSVAPACYDELRSSADWDGRWFALTRDSVIGTPRDLSRDFGTSPILIQHAYHLRRYEVATGTSLIDCDVIFEVGGGYGSFCRLLRNAGFNGLHIIYDLPHVSCIQRLFLRLSGYTEIDAGDAGSKINEHRFCLISDDRLDTVFELLKAIPRKAAFVATWSLSEMPISARQRIFPRFHEVSNRYLIAFQHEFVNLGDVAYNIENIEYFDAVRSTRPELKWYIEDINPKFYVRRHQYLFA
jgi:hypothetical protein